MYTITHSHQQFGCSRLYEVTMANAGERSSMMMMMMMMMISKEI
jgi:hypothetical protein